MPLSLTLDEAFARLDTRLRSGRFILGITGPPAAGKSTLAEQLLTWAASMSVSATVVPMDGFHLAQSVLEGRGHAEVKGAPHTFDAAGYAHLLQRLRVQREGDDTVWAPIFDRSIENAIAGSIGIAPADQLIVTEGNYLLLEADSWQAARASVDECWYLELSNSVRHERLTARHERFGRSPQEAAERTAGSDEANALLVAAARDHADVIVTVA